jgi:hypothetical protein
MQRTDGLGLQAPRAPSPPEVRSCQPVLGRQHGPRDVASRRVSSVPLGVGDKARPCQRRKIRGDAVLVPRDSKALSLLLSRAHPDLGAFLPRQRRLIRIAGLRRHWVRRAQQRVRPLRLEVVLPWRGRTRGERRRAMQGWRRMPSDDLSHVRVHGLLRVPDLAAQLPQVRCARGGGTSI